MEQLIEINIDKSSTSNTSKKGKLKVLLIEDDDRILRVHTQFLINMGLEVDTAITGEQAFTMYKNNYYPLVILDGGLPDMTGKDLGLLIREHGHMFAGVFNFGSVYWSCCQRRAGVNLGRSAENKGRQTT